MTVDCADLQLMKGWNAAADVKITGPPPECAQYMPAPMSALLVHSCMVQSISQLTQQPLLHYLNR